MTKDEKLVREQRRLIARIAAHGDESIACSVLGRNVASETAQKVSRLVTALAAVNASSGIVRGGETMDDSTVFAEAARIAKVPLDFAASLTPEERRRMRAFTP